MSSIFSADFSGKRSISVMYLGDQSKPYYLIYLYLPGHREDVENNFLIRKFEIDENQFDSIEMATEDSLNISLDTTLAGPYIFSFDYKETTKKFSTFNLDHVKKIFQVILKNFNSDLEKQKKIQRLTDHLLFRLKSDNQLKW